jgi:Uma2 family endonuclease
MARQTVLVPSPEAQPPRMTYEEFLRWVPDGKQAEWVDGEVFIVTTSTRHMRIGRLLTVVFQFAVEALGLGEVIPPPFQMRLRSRPSGREPDVLLLRTEHLNRVERHWVEGPADLAIEVISEDSVRIDRVDKYREYEQAGVPEYVIIDGRQGRHGFDFFRLDDQGNYQAVAPDGEGRYHSTDFPGLWLDASWFERDPLPSASELLSAILPGVR